MTVESPNVKAMWTTIEIDEEGVETVPMVENELELNAGHPAFDAAKVDALIEAAATRSEKLILATANRADLSVLFAGHGR